MAARSPPPRGLAFGATPVEIKPILRVPPTVIATGVAPGPGVDVAARQRSDRWSQSLG